MAEVARSKFDVDLRYGEAREEAFVHVLLRAHVEVKSDREAARTGKVFIEVRQGAAEMGKGRKSGLSVTEAHWWAIEIVGVCWVLIETDRLKALARQRWAHRVMGGDGNRYEGVLIPVELLVRPWRPA